MISSKTAFLFPVLVIFALFPFFEGGETSTGLFYFHTITLLALSGVALTFSRFWIPRFLVFFSPFFFVFVLSTFVSDYKFAAFLTLWDYFIAAVWAVLLCTVVRENRQQWESSLTWFFCTATVASFAAILIYNGVKFGRVSASFLNPNEYAIFALMLLCLGIFCLEKETNHRRKILIATLNGLLLLSVGLTFSRAVLIASIAVAFIAFIRGKPGKTAKIFLILLIAVSATLVAVRLKYYNDPLQYYRWKIWTNSLKGIAEDPYLGIGLGMLEYRSRTFNFPGEQELGRYRRIAKSADSQYVQILAETGFLGLLTFLFGWLALFFSLHKTPSRYFYLKQGWLIITIVSVFSVPLQNTSVFFLLLFLSVLAISQLEKESVLFSFGGAGRLLIPVGCFLLFVAGGYLPFQADKEFTRAVHSKNLVEADQHLSNALRYNPYQPYYRFFFITRIVDSNPRFESTGWLNLVWLIDQSIQLNPVEYQFYLYKGRIFRKLLEKDTNLRYYSSAMSAYQTAVDYNPHNVFIRVEFAGFLYQMKRYNLAERELRTALDAEPVYLNARLFLTEILISTNRTEAARKEYATFLDYLSRYPANPELTTPSSYIDSLLQVNLKHRNRIEGLLKPG